MIKAVIFDMDGVIIDSEPIHSKSWEKLLLEKGINPILNDQGLIHEIGPTGDESYKKIMAKHNLKEDLEIIRKKRREIFEGLLKEKLTPMTGFLELIGMLKKEKMKLALASNRIIEHVYMIIDNMGVRDFFEVIVTRNLNLKPKPSPDIYLQTAKELGIKPSECVAIEDSETGVIAAVKAGMKVIAIPNKYTSHHNFSKADKIVKSLNQVSQDLIITL